MDIFGNFSNLKGDKHKRRIIKEEELDFSCEDAFIEPIKKIEDKEPPAFLSSIKFVLVLFFLIIISKLFSLEVVNGGANQKLAEGNRIRPRIIEALRGLITDKNGVWLARNKPNFTLAVYPSDLPKKAAERDEIIGKVAAASGVSADEIRQDIRQSSLSPFESVVIKDNLVHDDALLLEEKIYGLPGVSVMLMSSREYAGIPGLSHIIGYTGKVSEGDIKEDKTYFLSDRTGKTGLEATYENYLRGIHGVEQIEVDSRGNVVRVLTKEGNTDPVPGNDVSLYLDRDLQTKAADVLKAGIESAKITLADNDINSGVVAVMDVKTGGMLALVSLPDYDNNLFSTKISESNYIKLFEDEAKPLYDRSIKGMYPPGSIIKIVMAAAGLAEKVINVNTSFDTPAEIKIGDYAFPDWKDHGVTNVERAIAESNNVFFYALGGGYDKIKGLGIDKINKYWRLFGLGEKTGIDIPGEEGGFLPDSEWKKRVRKEPWYIGDTYHVSIGQGDLLVTPLQMLRATAAIANGGKLLKPQMVKKIVDSTGVVVKEFGPSIERQNFVASDIIETVQRGMRLTVTDGSARNLADLPVSVAGKTGTAQFFANQKTHAWFEAYAPYENPEVAIVVLVEGGGGGHEMAAPIAREILNYYFTR